MSEEFDIVGAVRQACDGYKYADCWPPPPFAQCCDAKLVSELAKFSRQKVGGADGAKASTRQH